MKPSAKFFSNAAGQNDMLLGELLRLDLLTEKESPLVWAPETYTLAHLSTGDSKGSWFNRNQEKSDKTRSELERRVVNVSLQGTGTQQLRKDLTRYITRKYASSV